MHLSENYKVEQADLTRPMKIQNCCVVRGLNIGKMVSACRLHRRRVQHSDNCGCPSSPCPKVSYLSSSLCVSGTLQAVDLPLEPSVSACLMFEFPPAFCLTQVAGILTNFYSQILWDSSSWHWNPGLRSPGMGLGLLAP